MSDTAARAWKADAIEAAAFRDVYAAAPAPFARSAGLAVEDLAGATLLLAPGIPDPMFNRASGLGFSRPAREADIDEIAARYRAAGSPKWWIHWNPLAAPAEGPRWLEARGFALARRRSWAKVLHPGQPLPSMHTDLDLRPATPADAGAFAEIAQTAFGMPPAVRAWIAALAGRPRWRIWLAWSGARPVAAGALYQEGDAAWLGFGTTLAEFRGRGAQGALMALRVREAHAAGARWIVTETGEPVADEPNPSLANMARCGFEKVSSRLNYEAPR